MRKAILGLATTTMLGLVAKGQPLWQWAIMFDGNDRVIITDILPDSTDGCVVVGSFTTDLFLPADTLNVTDGDPDGFVAKLNWAGSIVWYLRTSEPVNGGLTPLSNGSWRATTDHASSFSINGNVVAPPSSGRSLISFVINSGGVVEDIHRVPNAIHMFGLQPFLTLAGDTRARFILLYHNVDSVDVMGTMMHFIGSVISVVDTTGSVSWARPLRAGSSSYALTARPDGNGNVFITDDGYFLLEPEDSLLADHWQVMVASLDSTGQLGWAYHTPGEPFSPDYESRSTVCPNGDVLLAYSASSSIVIRHFNNTGDSLGVIESSYPPPDLALPSAPFLQSDGGILVGGEFLGTFSIGGHVFSTTNPNCFVAGADASGDWQWAVTDNGPGNVFGATIVEDPFGRIYGAGWFEDHADFGSTHLVPTHIDASFVFCLSTSLASVPASPNRNEVHLWPDPTTALLHTSFPLRKSSVWDMMGRERTSEVRMVNERTIDVSRLQKGAYLLSIGTERTRFIKE